jgi:hypothetical protein
VDFSDLIVENRIPSKLATIWSDLVFNDESRCVGDGSVLPAELVDSLKVCAKFVRAWIESAIVAESSEMDCHVRIVLGVIDVVVGFVIVIVVVVFVVDVVAEFVRAWVESAIVAESSEVDCHVRIVLGVIDVVVGFVSVVVVVFVVDVACRVVGNGLSCKNCYCCTLCFS